MEDAGFIVGSYVLTFVTVGLVRVALRPQWSKARRSCAGRGEILALTEQNEP